MSTFALTYGHLADLALGSVDVGAVNFNILHTLLHAMLDKLGLSSQQAEISEAAMQAVIAERDGLKHRHVGATDAAPIINHQGSNAESVSTGSHSQHSAHETNSEMGEHPTEAKKIASMNPNTKAFLGIMTPTLGVTSSNLMQDMALQANLDVRLARLEEFYQHIDSLSTAFANEDQSSRPKSKPLSEYWQATQFQKKLDANTLGIDRLCELFEDIKFTNEKLQERLNEHKHVIKDEEMALLRDMLKNAGWSECCKKLQNQVDSLSKKTQWVPTVEFMSNFVTWHGLEDLFEGEDHDWKLSKNKLKDINTSDMQKLDPLDSFTHEELEQGAGKGAVDFGGRTDDKESLDEENKDHFANNQALKTIDSSDEQNKSNHSSKVSLDDSRGKSGSSKGSKGSKGRKGSKGSTISSQSSETCDGSDAEGSVTRDDHKEHKEHHVEIHTKTITLQDDHHRSSIDDDQEDDYQDKSTTGNFSFRASFGGGVLGGGGPLVPDMGDQGAGRASMWKTSDWSRISMAAVKIRTGESYVPPGKEGGKTTTLAKPLGPSKSLHWTMGSLGELVKKLDELADLQDRFSDLEDELARKADRSEMKTIMNELLEEKEREAFELEGSRGGSDGGFDGEFGAGFDGDPLSVRMTPAEMSKEIRGLKQQMTEMMVVKAQLSESHVPELVHIASVKDKLKSAKSGAGEPRFLAFSMLELTTKAIDDHFGKMDKAFTELSRHLRCEMRAQENRMKSYGQAAASLGPDPYALNSNCEPVDDRSGLELNDRFIMLEKSMGVKGMEIHGVQIKIAMINQDINRQLNDMRDKFCKVNNRLFRMSQGLSAAMQHRESARLNSGAQAPAGCQDSNPLQGDSDECGGDLGPEFMEPGPLKDMMESLQKVQTDVAGLICSNEALSEDNAKIQGTLLAVVRFNDEVKTTMVTKDEFRTAANLKADKSEVQTKLSVAEFNAAFSDFELQFGVVDKKINESNEKWRETFETLCGDLNNTVTLEEFEAVRDIVEEHMKILAKKLQKIQRTGGGGGGPAGGVGTGPASGGADSAAAMRQVSDGHGHCLSCDRPLQYSKEPRPSIPSKEGMMPPKSIKPYTTYELEQIRQQSKGHGPAQLSNFERAMMERQLTRIKIRDLRSDYANYWRNQDTCSAGPRGTKTVRKNKGMQMPSVEQIEIQTRISPKKVCGGVQHTSYLKTTQLADIGGMFSHEDVTKLTSGNMQSVGSAMRWESASSHGSDDGKKSVKDSFGGAYKIQRVLHRDSFGAFEGHGKTSRASSNSSISRSDGKSGSKGSGSKGSTATGSKHSSHSSKQESSKQESSKQESSKHESSQHSVTVVAEGEGGSGGSHSTGVPSEASHAELVIEDQSAAGDAPSEASHGPAHIDEEEASTMSVS